MNVTYLGPRGTFAGEAAALFFASEPVDFQPISTVSQVLAAVESGQSTFGVVPVENSVQGEVTTTLDSLVFDFHGLQIAGEVVLEISLYAFRKPHDLSPPSTIYSHPHALAQCTRFIERLNVTTVASKSTADACDHVASSGEPGAIAIASQKAGLLYNLEIMEPRIDDFPGAATRFLIIGTKSPAKSGMDKTVFVIIPKNQSKGVLAEVLQTLADGSLDIYSIHSRPVRRRLGTYCFFLTISGHINESYVFDALSSLLHSAHRIKFLGSYREYSFPVPEIRLSDIARNFLNSSSELAKYRAR
jgi:prephenate dehydratase